MLRFSKISSLFASFCLLFASGSLYSLNANATGTTGGSGEWTIIFHANTPEGANLTGNMENQVITPEIASKGTTLNENQFKVEGYTFKNWKVTVDGEDEYWNDERNLSKDELEAFITAGKNYELFAQWEKNDGSSTALQVEQDEDKNFVIKQKSDSEENAKSDLIKVTTSDLISVAVLALFIGLSIVGFSFVNFGAKGKHSK